MNKLPLAILASATLFASSSLMAQLTIDFESPTYSDGEIVGQGVFTNNTGIYAVDGGVLDAVGTGTSGFIRFDPTAGQIGVADISNITEQIAFSFDLQLPTLDSDSVILSNFSIRDSVNQLMTIQIRNDGRLRASGVNFNNAIDSTGFTTVSGVLDFGTDTFSLSVGASELSSSLAFDNASSEISQVRIQKNNDGAISFDNISLAAIPEPSSYALLAGLFGLAAVAIRRRR